jgi:hypothetical protein
MSFHLIEIKMETHSSMEACMAITLLFPYTLVINGTQSATLAPTADSLPITPTTNTNLVLTQQVGVFAAGAYQWTNNKWQFVIDYQTICNELFILSQAFLIMPSGGDNILPIGDSGAAIVSVYRNGVLQQKSAYTVIGSGISLVRPAAAYEVYLVFQNSPITPTTPIPSGGGISDAPSDGNAYVRKNAAWGNIQNELNEGAFTGI